MLRPDEQAWYAEAERRGVLSPEEQAWYAEAKSRGLAGRTVEESGAPRLVGIDEQANAAYGDRLKSLDLARRVAVTPPSAIRAFNRGVLDTGEGVAQVAREAFAPGTAKTATDAANQGRAEYQQQFGDIDPQALRTVGSVAPTLAIPMGASTTIPRLAAQSAGIGGLLGAAQFQPENADASFSDRLGNRASSAGVGALTGGGTALALGGGLSLAGKGINAVRGRYDDPAAQELLDLSSKYGVRLQYPDISGKGKRVSSALENIPLVGTAGERSLGHKEAAEATSKFTSSFTGGKSRQELGEAAKVSLLTKAGNARKVVKNLYADAAKNADPLGDLGAANTLKEIDSIIKGESKQVVPDTGLIKYLGEMKSGLSGGQPSNFTRLTKFQDKIQSDVSDFYKGRNAIFGSSGVGPLQGLKKSLDQDIEQGLKAGGRPKTESAATAGDEAEWAELMDFANSYAKKAKKRKKSAPKISAADELAAAESDLYGDQIDVLKAMRGQPVRKDREDGLKAFDRWKQADQFYQEKISPFREDISAIKSIKDPDELYKRFQSLTKSKPESVYNALTPEGRKAIRGLTVDDAFKTALTENGGKFSEAKFAGSLERRQRDVGVFFKGADKQEVDGFTKLMRHAQEHGFSSADPINGSRLLPWILGGATIGAGTVNVAAPIAGYSAVYGVRLLFTTDAGKRLLLASSKLPATELQRAIKRYAPLIAAELSTQAKQDVPRGTLNIPTTATGAR